MDKLQNDKLMLWHVIVIVITFLFLASYFGFLNGIFITFPILASLWLWLKSGFDKKKKIRGTILVVIIAVAGSALVTYVNRAPVLTITNPENNSSIQAGVIDIQGKVSPSSSDVTVNGLSVVTKNGVIDYKLALNKDTENNQINIGASNGDKTTSKILTITRIFTDQEKADIQARTLKAQQDADALAAQIKADQAAYDKSPAGRLCKKHTDWSKNDCEMVANKDVWIGMTLDMLKAERGLPSSANESNYGRGSQWQWCWENDDYSQDCFYGGDDMIITSYN
jgi:hypothetical protein